MVKKVRVERVWAAHERVSDKHLSTGVGPDPHQALRLCARSTAKMVSLHFNDTLARIDLSPEGADTFLLP